MARFWELGLVRRAPDLYALTVEQLLELDGFQQRSAENVIASIARVDASGPSGGCCSASASRTSAP